MTMPLPIGTVLAFALVSLLVELTPGPNMAYLALLAISRGPGAGMLATAGVALGLLLIGLAAAFGAATIMETSPIIYEVFRWSGVAFLLWLAWEGWMEADAPPAAPEPRDHRHFLRGLITNLLNPKAALFYLAVVPAFVARKGAALDATITLTLVYVVIATAVHAGIVLLAGALSPLLSRISTVRTLRRGAALLVGGTAVWLALVTAR